MTPLLLNDLDMPSADDPRESLEQTLERLCDTVDRHVQRMDHIRDVLSTFYRAPVSASELQAILDQIAPFLAHRRGCETLRWPGNHLTDCKKWSGFHENRYLSDDPCTCGYETRRCTCGLTALRSALSRETPEAPKMDMIKVPDVPAPTKTLCWKQNNPTEPPFTHAMVRCDRQQGHAGPHSWDWAIEVEQLRSALAAQTEALKNIAGYVLPVYTHGGKEFVPVENAMQLRTFAREVLPVAPSLPETKEK